MQMDPRAFGNRIDPRRMQQLTGQMNIMQQLAQSNYGRPPARTGQFLGGLPVYEPLGAARQYNPTPAGYGQTGLPAAAGAPRSVPSPQTQGWPTAGGLPTAQPARPAIAQIQNPNYRPPGPVAQTGQYAGYSGSTPPSASFYGFGGGLPQQGGAPSLGPSNNDPRVTIGGAMLPQNMTLRANMMSQFPQLASLFGGQRPAAGGGNPAPSAGAAAVPTGQPIAPTGNPTPAGYGQQNMAATAGAPRSLPAQSQTVSASQQTPPQVLAAQQSQLPTGRTPEQQAMLDAAQQRAIKQIGADPRYTAAFINLTRPLAGPLSLGAAGYGR